MDARFGQLGQLRSPASRAFQRVRGSWRTASRTVHVGADLPLSLRGSDAGIGARVRRRLRAIGMSEVPMIVEAWHGELTLRGTLPRDDAKRVEDELMSVRGVKRINNFLHP